MFAGTQDGTFFIGGFHFSKQKELRELRQQQIPFLDDEVAQQHAFRVLMTSTDERSMTKTRPR